MLFFLLQSSRKAKLNQTQVYLRQLMQKMQWEEILLTFYYITKIRTLQSSFVKKVWCHFDSGAGPHEHKSLMQDLT